MITSQQILESISSILEARVVANVDSIDRYLSTLDRSTDKSNIKQWIKTRLRKYLLNDYPGVSIKKSSEPGDFHHYNSAWPEYVQKAILNNEEVVEVDPSVGFINKIDHVIDYFNSDDAPQGALHGISVENAIRKSEEWNEILARRAADKETEEDYRIIAKDGGYTWVELLTKEALEKETKFMSHCVGDPNMGYLQKIQRGDCQIISLRDSSNKPHVTMEVNGFELEQVQGHGNDPVSSKYLQICYDFLNHYIKPKQVHNSVFISLKARWENEKFVKATFTELIDMIDIDYASEEEIEEIIEIGKQEGGLDDLNHLGYSALHLILLHGEEMTSVVKSLLDAGADVNVKTSQGVTPIVLAVNATQEWDSSDVFDLLLKRGADANSKDYDGDPVIFYVLRIIEDDKQRDNMVDSLIRIGKADMNVKDHNYRQTPLISAMLLNHKVDRDGDLIGYDESTVSTILSYGKPDVTIKDRHGRDALSYAIGFNSSDLIYELIRKGSDPNQIYPDGTTPLEDAIELSAMDAAWELLRWKIKPETLQKCLDYCKEYSCDTEFEKELKARLGIDDEEEEEE
jgi:hypothetical protein